MRKYRNLLMLLGLMVLMSCERRALEEPEFSTQIEVRINLNTISNVTCDIYNDKIPVPVIDPEVMKVLFYDIHSHELVAESFISDISDKDGQKVIKGRLNILPGEYSMMLYQFGSDFNIIRNEAEYGSAFVYTEAISKKELTELKLLSSSSPAADTKFDGWSIHYQPDHMLVASSDYENIPYHKGVHTINTEASSIAESYYLQVKVDGLEHVSSAKAVITSMAGQANISTREKDFSDPCAIYTHLQKSDDNGTPVVCSIFNTFGHIPDMTTNLFVTFNFWTTDGRNIEKKFDISDIFKTEDCIKRHWILVNETVVIPPPEKPEPGTGGGFDPSVGDWDEEHHEIEI